MAITLRDVARATEPLYKDIIIKELMAEIDELRRRLDVTVKELETFKARYERSERDAMIGKVWLKDGKA